ncbi:serine/threonine-protein kinase Sgk2 [Xylaria curta]|nr:serine/threonine-protein kinase Sgk2 [Xylaria curta]
MPLTEEQIDIISQRPLDGSLLEVRDKLRKNPNSRDNILNLLTTLFSHGTAANLPYGRSYVKIALVSVVELFWRDEVDLDQFLPLVRHIIDKSPDNMIWAEVFRLINVFSPKIPNQPSRQHRSVANTFSATPVVANSPRLDGNPGNPKTIEAALFQQLKTCTFRPVEGFFQKFFNADNCGEGWEAMVENIKKSHVKGRWAGFPDEPCEAQVWTWLRSLEDNFLTGAPYKLHTTKTHYELNRKGQMDIFFKRPGIKGERLMYKDVLVVGEHKKTHISGRFKGDLLQVARYVRYVFSDQPTRLFVHAFTFYGPMMELWIFDRSGAYSSGSFDIHEKPDLFARVLAAYVTMKDEAISMNTHIKREDDLPYIELDHPQPTKIWLDRAIFRQSAIVCRRTTCYVTRDGNVAKFSWTSDKRPKEIEHLRLAEARGVKGVAKLVAWGELSSTETIRKGLTFPPEPHPFRNDKSLSSAMANVSISEVSRNLFGNASESERTYNAKSLDYRLIIKPGLYAQQEDPWDNRNFSCLAVSPAGRIISDFRNMKELLESMRDAIKAHSSLFMTGDILHRDISPNNIIITDPKKANGHKGMLIDLDLAKIKDSPASGARHQTGTMQFMAIEVLGKIDHTYRHDLESFFYVLLWMCAHQAWDNGFTFQKRPFKKSRLLAWEGDDFEQIAEDKGLSMTTDGVIKIIGQFPLAIDGCVAEFCLAIRQILFPQQPSWEILIETPEDPNTLYGQILTAYDEVIKKL